MHVPSCFGTAHHDTEASPPKTSSQRTHTFSLRRRSPPDLPQPAWLTRDAYMDIKALQHGSEAKAYVTKSIHTGRVYVVKRFSKYAVLNDESAAPPGEQPLPNEAFVLLKVLNPHPNILEAFGCDLFGKRFSNLYTAHCTGGDLLTQMQHFCNINRTPPERFVLHAFISLAHALCYIHNGLRWNLGTKLYSQDSGFDQPFVHADLKLENCFLHWSEEAMRRGLPNVILGDFGAAQPEAVFKGIAGTPGYQAPEIVAVYKLQQTDLEAFKVAMKTTGYMTLAADVWSLGQTIHMLCTGRQHLVVADPLTLPVRNTTHGMVGVKLGGRRGYDTAALQETVQSCLAKDPLMRPKTKEGSLLGAIAIFQDALEKLESQSPKIPSKMWASPP
jgi:serine/threonine protein kinase